MSCILYYSNYCQHSKKLLQNISKMSVDKEIHFICIDNREQQQGKTFIIMKDGSKMIMPESVTKVPALMLLNDNYKVIYGESILAFINRLRPQEQVNQGGMGMQQNQQINANFSNNPQFSNEPSCYSFGNSGSFISSDNYSFLDMNSDSLGTKGDGGLRQMHNYVSLSDNSKINTPSDEFEYKTERQGEMTMEAYQAQRDADMNNINYKQY